MTDLLIGTIAFNTPWAISEQIRLYDKNLADPHELRVYDNSSDPTAAAEIEQACAGLTPYIRLRFDKHEHHLALNAATSDLLGSGVPFIGLIDHDIFPAKQTALIPLISEAGFYGVGQTHTPRRGEARRYLWPGFAFFERAWLNGRALDFEGIRAEHAWDDGDTGSMLHTLFTDEDWARMHAGTHGYGLLRPEDSHGLQSYGLEWFDETFVHFTNLSRWKAIPDADGRERLIREMVAAL